MENQTGQNMGILLGRYITEGNIDEAMKIITKLNKMDADIEFKVTPMFVAQTKENKVNVDNKPVEVKYDPKTVATPPVFNENALKIINYLVSMGYSQDWASWAAQRVSSIEAAVALLAEYS
ncbi:hypothetical protein SteCoe_16364 [Stentor coeruleus]|uniref:UBA domain-containing protein n=1 Tax=Stentor coeruleus TaxID=5963 RepID=A0A1R2C1H7_9CILI|nr:hypothetical protein SteCoe_16364 [Stentor coeruleus]